MNTDRMQTQRFELKYQVPESVALAARRFVRAWLVPDDFGGSPEAPSYPVHSLYLDSDDLQLYQSTVNGDRNRFKLRVRYYDENPATPVYLEIKRRIDRCIHKQRALVHRAHATALVQGEAPMMHHLARPDARSYTALQDFCLLMHRIGAKPRAHIGYDREAWVSPGTNAVRVTMDRRTQCEPMPSPFLPTTFAQPAAVFDDTVVLEIKFTNRFPAWLRDMVSALGLVQGSAAKYVDGVVRCGETHFRSTGKPLHDLGEIRKQPRAGSAWATASSPSASPA